MVLVLALGCGTASGMADGGDGSSGGAPSPPSMRDAMRDPAMLDSAMKMMQNPLIMQQMKVMMQDPAVKERMKRMLQRLGSDSALEGADALATDDAALDAIFERMQDPAVLERLQALSKNESFQARVQQVCGLLSGRIRTIATPPRPASVRCRRSLRNSHHHPCFAHHVPS